MENIGHSDLILTGPCQATQDTFSGEISLTYYIQLPRYGDKNLTKSVTYVPTYKGKTIWPSHIRGRGIKSLQRMATDDRCKVMAIAHQAKVR